MQDNASPVEKHDVEYLLEAAACLWEAFLNLHSNGNATTTRWLEAEGFSVVRLEVVGWASEVLDDFAKVAFEYTECFDWDFAPAWLDKKLEAIV